MTTAETATKAINRPRRVAMKETVTVVMIRLPEPPQPGPSTTVCVEMEALLPHPKELMLLGRVQIRR